MSNDEKEHMTREELISALEIYGGDVERMPGTLQQQVTALAANDAAAKALIKQARALDEQLLEDELPEFDLAGCEAAIFEAIDKEQTDGKAGTADNVIQMPVKSKTEKVVDAPDRAKPNPANDNGVSSFTAAGLLAASLLFGVMFGSLGVPGLLDGGTSLTIASNELNDDIFYTDNNLTLESDFFAIDEDQ